MKTCGRCKLDLPTFAFSLCSKAPDGLQRWCKPCRSEHGKAHYRADPEKFRSKSREFYRAIPLDERPAINRRANLQKYGLTPEAFDEMLAQQGGVCAVCSSPEPGGRHGQWFVDHDHSCCPGPRTCGDCVRGLLCAGCNSGLGMFEDDTERLHAAAAYLLRTRNAIGGQ